VASPTITVVIPTLNEAESIGQTIDAIPRAPHIHVMIVDGASKDGTQDIARGRGAEVVVEPARATAAPTRRSSRPRRATSS